MSFCSPRSGATRGVLCRDAAEPFLVPLPRGVRTTQHTEITSTRIYFKAEEHHLSLNEHSAGSSSARASPAPLLDLLAIIFPFWEGEGSSTSSCRTGGTSTHPFCCMRRRSTLCRCPCAAHTLRWERWRQEMTCGRAEPKSQDLSSPCWLITLCSW